MVENTNTMYVPDHGVKDGLCRVLAQRGQHLYQVLLVNKAVPVLVDHVEGFLLKVNGKVWIILSGKLKGIKCKIVWLND